MYAQKKPFINLEKHDKKKCCDKTKMMSDIMHSVSDTAIISFSNIFLNITGDNA